MCLRACGVLAFAAVPASLEAAAVASFVAMNGSTTNQHCGIKGQEGKQGAARAQGFVLIPGLTGYGRHPGGEYHGVHGGGDGDRSGRGGDDSRDLI